MIEFLLLIVIVSYIIYAFFDKSAKDFELDLINSLNIISTALKEGHSVETAITDLSKGKGKSASLYNKILNHLNSGLSLSEAFKLEESRSKIIPCITKIMSSYQDSGKDISRQLMSLSSRTTELMNIKNDYYSRTHTEVLLIQVLSTLVVPMTTVFSASLLEIPLEMAVSYYMLYAVLVYGFLDYFVYSDIKKAIFSLPVYLIMYIIIITKITPYLIDIFR